MTKAKSTVRIYTAMQENTRRSNDRKAKHTNKTLSSILKL